jgi:leader peptidase (prepilin peptidase)/N-methyltransferase
MVAPENSIVVIASILGLVFGSFLNVCIVRLPKGESVLAPRSHCRQCQHTIRAMDNIPVLGWVLLRGRCRDCGAKISLQYPLVEAATGMLFAACVAYAGATWQGLLDAAAIFFLLGLAMMDAQTYLLPNAFTYGGMAMALLIRTAAPLLFQRNIHAALLAACHVVEDMFLAAAILLAVRWTYFWLRKQEGMGLGDIKLLAMMAAFLGLRPTLLAGALAVLAGAAVSLVLLARGRMRIQDRIPFGSFLALSGIAVVFIGPPLLRWYLGFFR